MRKLIALAVAGGALFFAATAQAASYAGPMQGHPNSKVEFEVNKASSGKRFVEQVNIIGAAFQCQNGPQEIGVSPQGRARVRHGEFELVENPDSSVNMRFAGRLTSGSASGTFKAQLTFQDHPFGTCTTKRLGWGAIKLP